MWELRAGHEQEVKREVDGPVEGDRGPEKTQQDAVLMLLKHKPSILPDNKRVLENTLSSDTGGYAKACKRLPLSAVKWLAQNVSQALIDVTQPSLLGKRVYFFDGTTMTLAPVEALRKVYSPASNQYGEGAFPVALLVMAFELQSGAAVLPEIGAMYGPKAVSETALVRNMFLQLPKDSVVTGAMPRSTFATSKSCLMPRRCE